MPPNSTIYIVKPEGGAQGKGIYLTRKIDGLQNKRVIVQKYLDKPYLIDGYKFDLRLYVLVTSVDPLKIFFFKKGIARFASSKYNKNNIDFSDKRNMYVHLTNYSINKNYNRGSPKLNQEHCKKSLAYVIDQISYEGYDTELLMTQIHDIIVKTLISIQPKLLHTYNVLQPRSKEHDMCFEVLGFDIFIDENVKPWLIEVNHMPSYQTDSDLDLSVKEKLIRDTFTLININSGDK